LASRERKTDVHLTGPLQRDPATRHPTVTLFELSDVFCDGVVNLRRPGHALKIDFECRLHHPSPN
jgi:hypothetical protein